LANFASGLLLLLVLMRLAPARTYPLRVN
jgi:hypothetical protein